MIWEHAATAKAGIYWKLETKQNKTGQLEREPTHKIKQYDHLKTDDRTL